MYLESPDIRHKAKRYARPYLYGPLHPLHALGPVLTPPYCLVSELLYHFKGSFDGVPDSDNPFVSKYVPWCIQDPLLSKTSLYISARSLAERGFVDPTSAIRLKLSAIHSLNQLLRSASWITDEALAGVVQFVSIEWFFGEPKVVQAHLTGLRDMVRLRGGFTQTGVGALVTKVALV